MAKKKASSKRKAGTTKKKPATESAQPTKPALSSNTENTSANELDRHFSKHATDFPESRASVRPVSRATAYARARVAMMQQMEYLRQRPGFQFADVGYKYIQHERTDFIAVRIYVDRKRDDDGIIEKTCYHEFVPTDVIECRFEKAVAQTNAGDKLRSDGNAGFGTLGMGVDYFGTPHFLTCAHVVSDQQPPSTAVNYVTDINNTLVGRSKNSDDGFYRYDGSFDLALLLPSNFVATDELGLFKYPLEPGLAKPTRISNVGSTDLLRPVYKIGAKTGLRRGHIDSVDPGPIPIADSPDALNHIVIVSNSSQQPFAEPGDSGSVVITDNGEIIGMVRAVQIGTRERTVVTRMFEIAASFGINAPLG